VGELVDITAKANFRALGARFGKQTPRVANAIAAADAATLAGALNAGSATVDVDGESIALSPDEVLLTEAPRAGWAVASDAGLTVALDLEVTPELRRAGIARDVVRVVQESRKTLGLDVSDRIELWWRGDGELAEAMREHGDRIADEVLAVRYAEGRPNADVAPHTDAELGLTWWLRPAAS